MYIAGIMPKQSDLMLTRISIIYTTRDPPNTGAD